MTDATTIMTWYQKNWPVRVRHYELPNVAPGGVSDMIRLVIPGPSEEWPDNTFNFMLRGLKIGCDSTNFEISIFNEENGVQDSINECVRYVNINRYEYEAEMTLIVINRDTVQSKYIYCKVTNNDGSNATGPIDLELYVT